MMRFMVVKAILAGSPVDLDALVDAFREGDPRVVADDDGYYLTSAEFDGLSNGSEFSQAASSMLQGINGVARALDGSYRPVSLAGRFVDGSGITHVVAPPDTAEARDHALPPVIRGELGQSVAGPPGPAYFELAKTSPDVAKAQAILGKPLASLDWYDLYKLYEIVRRAAGGDGGLESKGWAGKKELSSFRISANHPDLSGEDARHAVMGNQAPSYSTSLAEGRALISRLMIAWWDELDAAT